MTAVEEIKLAGSRAHYSSFPSPPLQNEPRDWREPRFNGALGT